LDIQSDEIGPMSSAGPTAGNSEMSGPGGEQNSFASVGYGNGFTDHPPVGAELVQVQGLASNVQGKVLQHSLWAQHLYCRSIRHCFCFDFISVLG
jgi:hypothetical protein